MGTGIVEPVTVTDASAVTMAGQSGDDGSARDAVICRLPDADTACHGAHKCRWTPAGASH